MKLKSILIVALAVASIMALAGGNVAMAACTGNDRTVNTICTTTTGVTGMDGSVFRYQNAGIGGTDMYTLASQALGTFSTDALGTAGSGTGLAGGMPPQVAYSTATGDYTSGVGPTSGYLLSQTLFAMCAATCPKFVPIAGTDVSAFSTGNSGNLVSYTNATGGDGTAAFSTVPAGTDNFNQATFETGLVTGFNEGAAANIGILSQKTYHHNFNGTSGSDGDYVDQRLAQQVDANGTTAAAGQQRFAQTLVASAGSGGTVQGAYWNEITPGPGGGVNIDSTWIGNVDGCGVDLPGPSNVGLGNGNCGVVNQSISDTNAGAGINGTTGVVHNGSYGQIFNPLETIGTNTILAAAPAAPNTTYAGPAISTAASALTLP